MKKILFLSGMILFTGLMFTSCTKDEDEPGLPTVAFNQIEGYVTGNTTAAYGDTLRFGIILQGNGSDNIVKFEIKANDETLLDSTINTSNFTFDFYSIKGTNAEDVWKFTATDIAGNKKEETITITGAFGELDSYVTVLMGAQDNVTVQSFLSLNNHSATRYFQAEAFNNQEKIDMFCFYEDANMMALASPGTGITGVFTGTTSPENYTTKNLTWFVKTSLTAAQFDAVQNDAIVLDSYDTDNDFRKAKLLTAGDVYCFKLQNGKYGLLKVIEVTGAATGTLEIAIKVQK